MDEILQEFVDSRDAALRVDRTSAVIRGVKLLGLQSRNGRRYLPAALVQAAGLYEGAKVNVNHPKGSPLAARDYQDRLGVIHNVRAREGQGLYGDLHFNPKHALAEQLLWDAANAPQNVGLSHNVEARTTRHDGQVVVEAILKVQSVDLVADPATTAGLFEGQAATTRETRPGDPSSTLAEMTLEQLRADRPDLVAAIRAADATELAHLRSERDRLRACEAQRQKRTAATRLLREFQLPDPEVADVASRPLVSAQFMEALLASESETAMRAMVEERAAAIAAARRGERQPAGRPTSREQHAVDSTGPAVYDALSFVRAIT